MILFIEIPSELLKYCIAYRQTDVAIYPWETRENPDGSVIT